MYDHRESAQVPGKDEPVGVKRCSPMRRRRKGASPVSLLTLDKSQLG